MSGKESGPSGCSHNARMLQKRVAAASRAAKRESMGEDAYLLESARRSSCSSRSGRKKEEGRVRTPPRAKTAADFARHRRTARQAGGAVVAGLARRWRVHGGQGAGARNGAAVTHRGREPARAGVGVGRERSQIVSEH